MNSNHARACCGRRQVAPLRLWSVVLILLLSTGVAAVGGTATAAEKLTVTGSLWIPYIDGELPNGGLASDLVRTALTRAGYEIEASVETWPRAYQGAALGVYDVVAAVWQTAMREQDLLFSDAYLLNDIVFLARRGVFVEYESLADLTGFRIGVVRDYAYDDAFDRHPELYRVGNNHLIQNLLLLRAGKLDMVVGDKWSIFYQISQFMPDDIDRFRLLPKPLARRALRLGVSRGNQNAAEIVAAFDAEIAAMKEDGAYAEIVQRHTQGIAVLPGKR